MHILKRPAKVSQQLIVRRKAAQDHLGMDWNVISRPVITSCAPYRKTIELGTMGFPAIYIHEG